MKHYEEFEITKKEKRLRFVECDICGNRSNSGGEYTPGGYGVSHCTVQYDEGDHYPEGRMIERESFDICPDCWELKLAPFIESFGAKRAVYDPDD